MEKKQNYYKSKRLKELTFYICILAVPVLQFAVFYIGVNFNSILMAFQSFERDSETMVGSYEFLQGDIFANFKLALWQLKNDTSLEYVLGNSLLAFIVTVGVGTTLALLFSLYIYKKMFLSKTFRLLLFAPSILSTIVTVLMYQNFVEIALPEMIPSMNGIGLLSNMETAKFGLLFYSVWIGFGTQILMYSGAMNTIEESVVEAAKLDGAGPFREFVSIIFPLIYPTFVTFMITNIAGFFTNQLNLHVFYGNGAPDRFKTIGYYLYVQTLEGSGGSYATYPVLASYGLLFTLIAAPVTLLGRKFLEKIGPKTV